jgi:stress response protein YsnF
MTTVISAYNDQKIADDAIAALRKEGFADREVQILKGDTKKLMSELIDFGFEEDDARAYAKAADEGKTLVAASVAEEKADEAVAIMDKFEAGQGEGSEQGSAGTVPVVEEELSVAKSKTANGGARVTTRVSEKPVEETVNLKEEAVSAERRSVDRELNDEEADAAFEEKTVEMMGTKEEAEVQKEARVVGEVELKKETKERQKTVSDTVRRTDVEVEEVEAKASKKK